VHYSILPALTTEGVIALNISEGSVIKEQFLSFMQEHVVCASYIQSLGSSHLLAKAPQLNPYPGKRSVVIFDNCSIHHDKEL
jgi:hypothetical protein